ncbi:MAG TPA: glycogen phosphorylase, partial [Thiotrichales bacterium]|nr:glycogen phosphorylase [Thiotrichales bacterium]
EASGTGNRKFMMNGAITIGTYDGANIEILEQGGEENFFLFGLNAEQVAAMHHDYMPQDIIDNDEDISAVMDLLDSGHFNLFEPDIFHDILAALRNPDDPWLTLADFRAYIDCQQRAADCFRDRQTWTRMSILNTASSGYFSTDRTIQQYNDEIWKL